MNRIFYILMIVAVSFSTLTSAAQNQNNKEQQEKEAQQKLAERNAYYANADTASYGVRYRMKYKYNKEKKRVFEEDRVVLVSPHVTLDMSYESIGERRWRHDHPNDNSGDMSLAYRLTPSYYFYYPETGRGVSTYRVIGDEFKLDDSIRGNKWNITSETKKCEGFPCRKATLDRGGRQWTAWFTDSIAGVAAPMTFNGLPGVVIELTDADNDIQWKFHSIVNNLPHDPLLIKFPDAFTDIPVEKFPRILKIVALSNNNYIQGSGVLKKYKGHYPERYMPSTGLDACDITNPIER